MAGSTPSVSISQDELNAILCEAVPRQGAWTDEEYLWLTDRSRRLIEFTDGYVQQLPRPTSSHQAILALLYRLFHAWLGPHGGVVLFSALRLRVREGKFREPDLLVLRDSADPRYQDRYWLGADLVVEVVSPDRPERDLVDKKDDYAEAGIGEYWVVDPRDELITVLALGPAGYVEHGAYARGSVATSPLLDGFDIAVADVFDATGAGA